MSKMLELYVLDGSFYLTKCYSEVLEKGNILVQKGDHFMHLIVEFLKIRSHHWFSVFLLSLPSLEKKFCSSEKKKLKLRHGSYNILLIVKMHIRLDCIMMMTMTTTVMMMVLVAMVVVLV